MRKLIAGGSKSEARAGYSRAVVEDGLGLRLGHHGI